MNYFTLFEKARIQFFYDRKLKVEGRGSVALTIDGKQLLQTNVLFVPQLNFFFIVFFYRARQSDSYRKWRMQSNQR